MNRMTSIATITILVSAALAFFTSVATASPTATLTVVTEPPDANVQVTNAAGERYTAGTPTEPGWYHIHASRVGYKPMTYTIALAEAHQAVRIVLQPQRMATASTSFPGSASPGGEARLASGASSKAAGAPQIARYSIQAPVPLRNQRQLLEAVVPSIRFGSEVQTVGQAVDRVLAGSGYRLARGAVSDPEQPKLLSLALPRAHRQLGPISIRHALATLAGPGWQLVVDPVHRQIAYEVSAAFRLEERAASWTQ